MCAGLHFCLLLDVLQSRDLRVISLSPACTSFLSSKAALLVLLQGRDLRIISLALP
jgi:hypothetical protein